MSFADLSAELTDACFAQLGETDGEGCVFTPAGGAPVNTHAVLDLATRIATESFGQVPGDLGQGFDARTSVKLPRRVIGAARTGQVLIKGRTWKLDRLISDDGHVVHFFVK